MSTALALPLRIVAFRQFFIIDMHLLMLYNGTYEEEDMLYFCVSAFVV